MYQEDTGANTQTGVSLQDTADETQVVDSADDPSFDKARAMATIRQLRQFEKDAKAKIKRLEEFETVEKEKADKELSESERLKKELSELRATHKAAQADLQRARLLEAARKAAEKASLSFHSGALEDAIQLGVFSDLEWNDKGEPLGVGEAVKALAKDRPYLLRPATSATADLDGAKRGATNSADEQAERANKRLAAWGLRQR